MAKKLPQAEEILKFANEIEAMQLPRILTFADMIIRNTDKALRNNSSRLNVHALAFLITTEKGRERGLNHSELANLLIRSNHGVTRIVDALEKDGYVERRRDPNDRRTVYVKITSAGIEFMKNYIAEVAALEKGILSCLNANEIKTLRGLIRKIRHKFQELRS